MTRQSIMFLRNYPSTLHSPTVYRRCRVPKRRGERAGAPKSFPTIKIATVDTKVTQITTHNSHDRPSIFSEQYPDIRNAIQLRGHQSWRPAWMPRQRKIRKVPVLVQYAGGFECLPLKGERKLMRRCKVSNTKETFNGEVQGSLGICLCRQ